MVMAFPPHPAQSVLVQAIASALSAAPAGVGRSVLTRRAIRLGGAVAVGRVAVELPSPGPSGAASRTSGGSSAVNMTLISSGPPI